MRVRVAVVATLMLVLVGCDDGGGSGSPTQRASSVSASVPTVWVHDEPSENERHAIVKGRLRYDQAHDCFILVTFGARYPVVWPYRTTTRAEGPAVVLPNKTVTQVGDVVSGGGGFDMSADRFGVPVDCRSASGEVAVFNASGAVKVKRG